MVPLDKLEEGDQGMIVEITHTRAAGSHHCHKHCSPEHCRITDLGIRVGKTIQLLKKHRHGPLLVKVDESRIAIGRGMAEKIIIESPS